MGDEHVTVAPDGVAPEVGRGRPQQRGVGSRSDERDEEPRGVAAGEGAGLVLRALGL